MAEAVADRAIMEGCATAEEAGALAVEVGQGARDAGRDPERINLAARVKHLHRP